MVLLLILAATPMVIHEGKGSRSEARTGEETWSYQTGGSLFSVSISADGQTIAAGSGDQKVYLFDRDDSEPMWSYTTGALVFDVEISADGNYIVAGSYDDNVYLFHRDSSVPLWNATVVADILKVAISDDGSYLAAIAYDYTVYLFSRDSPVPLWSYATPDPGGYMWGLDISGDGQYIATGSRDRNVTLFHRSSGTPLWNYTTGQTVFSVSLSQDGSYLAAGCEDNHVYLFHRDSSTPLWSFEADGWVRGVAISEDGEYVAAGSTDNNVYLFARDSPQPLWNYTTSGIVDAVAISANGDLVAAGSFDDVAYLLSREGPNPVVAHLTGGDLQFHSVALSADGQTMVAGSADHKAYLLEPPLPDLRLTSDDVTYSPLYATYGSPVTISAKVSNLEPVTATATVRFYDGLQEWQENLIGSRNLTLRGLEQASVNISWNPTSAGLHRIIVVVEGVAPGESNADDNLAISMVNVAEYELGQVIKGALITDDFNGPVVGALWDVTTGSAEIEEGRLALRLNANGTNVQLADYYDHPLPFVVEWEHVSTTDDYSFDRPIWTYDTKGLSIEALARLPVWNVYEYSQDGRYIRNQEDEDFAYTGRVLVNRSGGYSIYRDGEFIVADVFAEGHAWVSQPMGLQFHLPHDASVDTYIDNVRVYPHPDTAPVNLTVEIDDEARAGWRVTASAAGADTVLTQGLTDDDGRVSLNFSAWQSFPAGARFQVFEGDQLLLSYRHPATNVSGIYPGDELLLAPAQPITLLAATDRTHYYPGDTVTLTAQSSQRVPTLLSFAILDPEGQNLPSAAGESTMVPGEEARYTFRLLPGARAGVYRVYANVSGTDISMSTEFEVRSLRAMTDRSAYRQGDELTLTAELYQLDNGEVTFELYDPLGELVQRIDALNTTLSGGAYEADEHTLALWHFDNLEGDMTPDASRNSFQGQVGGWGTGEYNATLESGLVNHGLSFHGASSVPYDVNGSYIRLDSQPELQLTRDLTIEMWVKPQGAHPNPPLITNHKPYDDTNGWALGLGGAGDKPIFTAFHPDGNADVLFPDGIPFDQWTHLAITFDDTIDHYDCYVNGELVRHGDFDINVTANLYDIVIGAIYTGAPGTPPVSTYDGMIDEVRISDIPRDPREFFVHQSVRTTISLEKEAQPGIWTLKTLADDGNLTDVRAFTVEPRLILEMEESDDKGTFDLTALLEQVEGSEVELELIAPDGKVVWSEMVQGTFKVIEFAPDEDTLGLWHFDEGSGDEVRDSSSSANHGTLQGGPDWVTGRMGMALNFDGFDDFVDLTGSGVSGTEPRTVIAWARTSSLDHQYILTYGGSAAMAGSTFRVGLNQGCQGVYVGVSDGYITYTASTADGQWHQYAYVVPDKPYPELSQVLVYRDGLLLTETCDNHKPDQTIDTGTDQGMDLATYFHVGDAYFEGSLDEIYISARPLEPREFCLAWGYQTEMTMPHTTSYGQWTLRATSQNGYVSEVTFLKVKPDDKEGNFWDIFGDLPQGTLLLILWILIILGGAFVVNRNENVRWFGHTGLFIPLFSHIRKEELEEPDKFKAGQLYQIIAMYPGVNLRTLKAITGMKNGHMVYHLERLERDSKITSQRLGQLRVFYVTEELDDEMMEPSDSELRYLRNTQREVLLALVDNPEASQRQIAELLGANQQLISYHLRELIRKDHIQRMGVRGFYAYRVKEGVQASLANGTDIPAEKLAQEQKEATKGRETSGSPEPPESTE